MLATFWSKYFQSPSRIPDALELKQGLLWKQKALENIQNNLHALVLKSGETKFIRKACGGCNSEPATLMFNANTLAGTTFTVTTFGHSDCAICCVLPAEIRHAYDLVSVGNVNVINHEILGCCFEDLADDHLTLELTVVKKPPTDDQVRPFKRARSDELSTTNISRSGDEEQLWEQVFTAYKQEISKNIDLPTCFGVNEPFLVSDVMAKPFDLFFRQQDTPAYAHRVENSEWTLIQIFSPLVSLSSGCTSRWKTLCCKQGVSDNVLCLQSKGHDSNQLSFFLRVINKNDAKLMQKRPDLFMLTTK